MSEPSTTVPENLKSVKKLFQASNTYFRWEVECFCGNRWETSARCGRQIKTQCKKCFPEPTLEEHFWSLVKKLNSNSCWEFTGCIESSGYGVVDYKKKRIKAHRLSYLLAYGSLTDDLCVCHKCDNPKCVNPNHLFEGTMADNVKDMDSKGRRVVVKGENHGGSKLNELMIRKIRSMHNESLSTYAISKLLGVPKGTVWNIVQRVSWKHID